MTKKLVSFPPVLPKKPKVLILGSMPSVQSLENEQYYGNPRNHFWRIMYALFNEKPVENYDEKIALLDSHHIALWDTIGSCYREGSLDAKISEEEPNDILGLIEQNPTIRLIACNGTKAYQTFSKHINLDAQLNIDVIKLPSTSPIPGRYTKTFTVKVAEWKNIIAYLA